MALQAVYTIADVSRHLRVPEAAIEQEIASGNLLANNIAGQIRILESNLNAYLSGTLAAKSTLTGSQQVSSGTRTQKSLQLTPASDFVHTWPAPKGKEKSIEKFTDVQQGVAACRGREYTVKIGFTLRQAAGKMRRRGLVLVDRYPTVEFVGADESSDGKMAAIIRDRKGKQLQVGATLPPEYQSLPVAPYSEVVEGPGASTGLAVVCDSGDIDTMVKHALIRTQFRDERP